jgi:type I restriction enzyme S subunit
MSFKSVKFKDTNINIIDGDRGENYPSQNEYLEDGYCLFLNAKNVTDSGFKFNKTKFISKEKDNILRKGRLKKEDVVLTTRGTVGNVGLFTHEVPYENIRINSGMLIFRLENRDEFLPEYIYWYFRSNLFQNQIKQYVSGSAQPQLPVKTINKMEILKPDIEIQKKIVKIISSVNKKVLNNNKMNKTLEEIAQAIYKSWFVDFDPFQDEEMVDSKLGEIPKNWEVKSLKDLAKFKNGINYKKDDTGNQDFKIVNVKNITRDNLLFIDKLDSIELNKDKAKRYSLKKWDTVISRSADPGKSMLCLTNKENLIHSGFSIKCRPKNNENAILIYNLIQGVKQQLHNYSNGTIFKNVNQKILKNIELVVPPKKIIKEFNERIISIYNRIINNEKENQTLRNLRKFLLSNLMSGEIRVPLDEDEKEVK